jgi:hypothetical protein
MHGDTFPPRADATFSTSGESASICTRAS